MTLEVPPRRITSPGFVTECLGIWNSSFQGRGDLVSQIGVVPKRVGTVVKVYDFNGERRVVVRVEDGSEPAFFDFELLEVFERVANPDRLLRPVSHERFHRRSREPAVDLLPVPRIPIRIRRVRACERWRGALLPQFLQAPGPAA